MNDEARVREKDLIQPVLELIGKYGDPDHGLEIAVISKKLRAVMVLTDDDRKILKGRKDDRFSQVVRNLVSHRTLEKEGLATYRLGGAVTKGSYVLTPKGKARLGNGKRTQLELFD